MHATLSIGILLAAILVLLVFVVWRGGGGDGDISRVGGLQCPHCQSTDIYRDSASPWIFVFAALTFPFGLILFALNKNVCCKSCGVRFKRK